MSRILFVSRSTTGHAVSGGMERAFQDIANRLASDGHELAILTTAGLDTKAISPTFGSIWQIPARRPGRYSIRWWLETAQRRRPWIAWAPDMVFSVSSGAASMPRLSAVPVLAQCHGTALAEVRSSLASPGIRELAKVVVNLARIPRDLFFYRRVSRVVAIGDAVVGQLEGKPISLDAASIELIPNGIQESVWQFRVDERRSVRAGFGLTDENKLLIYTGRVEVQKGVDLAIAAVADNPIDAGVHLLVCGSGSQLEEMKSLADRRGVRDRIHFMGRIEGQSELAKLMSAADVFLFPTRRREGLPLTILEAMASGLPVVTVANANVPPELAHNATVVDVTVQAIIAGINETSRRDSRESLLAPKFTADASLDSYSRLLQTVLSEAKGGIR